MSRSFHGGRGTGTAGGSLPEQGGIALSMERMLNIISVDIANRVIVAQPGVLNQTIQDAAKPHGFFWPPDPSSAAYSSIGGNIATSAGGRMQSNTAQLAIMYWVSKLSPARVISLKLVATPPKVLWVMI